MLSLSERQVLQTLEQGNRKLLVIEKLVALM